ncbi:MAG: L,D-transpeptidase [Polyangiaceae bacterium]
MLAALVALGLIGCQGDQERSRALQDGGLAAENDEIPQVPRPAEDGSKLLAKKADVPVRDRPKIDAPTRSARSASGLSSRAQPSRSRKTEQCPGGYYPVRPRGFVWCRRHGRSHRRDHRNHPRAGHLSRAALPIRLVRSATPPTRVLTAAEQKDNEPTIGTHLAKAGSATASRLRAGSNDVPLDDRGIANGVATLTKTSLGVTQDGKRTVDSLFGALPTVTPPALPDRASAPIVALVLRRGSGVALVGATDVEGPNGPRRMGVTPDGFLVPIDRLDPALGSTWHGVDLTKDKGLPIAFVLRNEVCPYALGKDKPRRLTDDEHERRTPVFLTNRVRTVDGVKYQESEDGVWFRDKDLITVVKRAKFPDFVHAGVRWVDISLALQTMTLYEGRTAIYATVISSGRDRLGDPATTASTMLGTFTITRKATTLPVDNREVDQAFDVLDAPYGLEFSPGFAITGSYWSEPAGEARGFHNVSITPVDAHRLYAWAGPDVPRGWQWYTPSAEETITVYVRK